MASPGVKLEPHPWNRGFRWRDHEGPFGALDETQARDFDRDGFFVLRDVLDREAVERTRREIDDYEAAEAKRLAAQPDQRDEISEHDAITFTGSLVERSPWLRQVVASERLTGILADLIGPNVILYWDQAVYKKPEKPRRFPWHQDTGFVFVEPQAYVTIWLALMDVTVENGCPQLVPGLHRQGTLHHYYVDPLGFECFPAHPDATPAELGAGSAVVFSSLTPHMTGPNTTREVRKGYVLQYAPEGAVMLRGRPEDGPPTRVPCTLPRQLPILRDGRPVAS